MFHNRKQFISVSRRPFVAAGGGSFVGEGVDFNGSEYVGTGFSGVPSSSKTGTVSVWLNPTVAGVIFGWQNASNFEAFFLRINGNFVQFQLYNAAHSTIMNLGTNSGIGSGSGIPPDSTPHPWVGAGWHWFAASWNLASTARHQSASNHYTVGGGLDQWDGSSWSDDFVVYPSGGNPYLGSAGGSGYYTGGVAEFMFWAGVSLDLSDTATIRKLISSTGHPVDPGSNGSTVTGSAPTFYFKGPAAGFGTNAAGTGNVTLNAGSAVTNSSTDP